METLPLELQHEIFAHLFLDVDWAAAQEPEEKLKASRTDVYNVRLTCRRIHAGASHVFVKIIEEVPTYCAEKRLDNLARLVALPGVGEHVTCLTITTCKLFIANDWISWQQLQNTSSRDQWLSKRMRMVLLPIFRNTVNLRGLTFLHELVHVTKDPGLISRSEIDIQSLDPIHVSCTRIVSDNCYRNLTADSFQAYI